MSRACTYLSRSSAALLRSLSSHPKPVTSAVTLCALSSNLSTSDLAPCISAIQNLFPNVVGTIVGSIDDTHTLSIASFDSGVKMFRTALRGEDKTAVGREVGKRRSSHPQIYQSEPKFQELDDIDEEQAQQVFYFSDDTPHNFVNRLTRKFPKASCYGLISEPTPFVTGRPFTMFRNATFYSDCQVGVVLSREARRIKITYDAPLQVLGSRSFTITKAKGNIIEMLDNQTPTSVLLSLFSKLPSDQKDVSLFAALYSDPHQTIGSTFNPSLPHSIYPVWGGDPARGNVALGTELDLRYYKNTKLQFLLPSSEPMLDKMTENEGIVLRKTPTWESIPDQDVEIQEGVTCLRDTWVASSDGGWIYSKGGKTEFGVVPYSSLHIPLS